MNNEDSIARKEKTTAREKNNHENCCIRLHCCLDFIDTRKPCHAVRTSDTFYNRHPTHHLCFGILVSAEFNSGIVFANPNVNCVHSICWKLTLKTIYQIVQLHTERQTEIWIVKNDTIVDYWNGMASHAWHFRYCLDRTNIISLQWLNLRVAMLYIC